MTLTSELGLDSVKVNEHAKYLGQRSFSSSYCPDTFDLLINLDH